MSNTPPNNNQLKSNQFMRILFVVPSCRSLSSLHGLHNLAPAPGSRTARKRIGRGLNAGGSMCGRGNAGQNSRSGPGPVPGFAGGQTPLWQRARKLGVVPDRSPRLLPVSLEFIQHLMLLGRLCATSDGVLHQADIFRAIRGSCSQGLQGIRVTTAECPGWFDHRLCIVAGGFSSSAIARIEQLDGVPVAVWHSPAAFRTLVHGPGLPLYHPGPPDYCGRVHYSSWANRGYLHDRVRAVFAQWAPTTAGQYQSVPAMEPIRLPPLPVFN